MCARLALMWHMHQPSYEDPSTGRFVMPWVLLHAAKDYREMLELALEARARVTFNFVPVLWDQLERYGATDVGDAFVELLRKPPGELTGIVGPGPLSVLLAAQEKVLVPDLDGFLTRRGQGDLSHHDAFLQLVPQHLDDFPLLYVQCRPDCDRPAFGLARNHPLAGAQRHGGAGKYKEFVHHPLEPIIRETRRPRHSIEPRR